MNLRRWFAATLCGLLLASGMAAGAQQAGQKPPEPVAIKLPSNKLAEYAGEYREASEPDIPVSVYVDGGKLYVEAERMARSELQPESADHFFSSGSELRADFTRNASGHVTSLKLSYGPNFAEDLERFSDKGVRLNHFCEYTRQVVMIPMRDGVKLHAVILRPAGSENSGEPLPF